VQLVAVPDTRHHRDGTVHLADERLGRGQDEKAIGIGDRDDLAIALLMSVAYPLSGAFRTGPRPRAGPHQAQHHGTHPPVLSFTEALAYGHCCVGGKQTIFSAVLPRSDGAGEFCEDRCDRIAWHFVGTDRAPVYRGSPTSCCLRRTRHGQHASTLTRIRE